MGTDTEVVKVAIQLCGMTCTSCILVHSSEFDIGLRNEVVHADSRHIQDTILTSTVTIEEVITQTELHLPMHEVAHLCIAAPRFVKPMCI